MHVVNNTWTPAERRRRHGIPAALHTAHTIAAAFTDTEAARIRNIYRKARCNGACVEAARCRCLDEIEGTS